MASSSSSSSKSSNLQRNTLCLILVFLVINGSCTATRPGVTITVDSTSWPLKEKHRTGFQYHGQVFSFFPKGTPLPPSGPSKRHNSVVDSTQN